MAKLRGSRFVREDIITEALTDAINYIDNGEVDLAKATLNAIINIYGNKKLNEGIHKRGTSGINS